MTPEERSVEKCPVCGVHALQLLYFPEIDVIGVRPYDDMLGFGDAHGNKLPGIGCRACGTEWPDLASFRAAQRDAEPGEGEPAQ